MKAFKPTLTPIKWAVMYHQLQVGSVTLVAPGDYLLSTVASPSLDISAYTVDRALSNHKSLGEISAAIKQKWGDKSNHAPTITGTEWGIVKDEEVLGHVRQSGNDSFNVVDRATGVLLRQYTTMSAAVDWAMAHWGIRAEEGSTRVPKIGEVPEPCEEELEHLTFSTALWTVTVSDVLVAWVHQSDRGDYIVQRAINSWRYSLEHGRETAYERLRKDTLEEACNLAIQAFYAAEHGNVICLPGTSGIFCKACKWIVSDDICNVGTIEKLKPYNYAIFDYYKPRCPVRVADNLKEAKEFCVRHWRELE